MLIWFHYQTSGQQLNGLSNNALPGDDIWLHTDRDEYIAGENCWFAAYLFDRNNNNKPGVSTIAYVELLNYMNSTVIQKRIRLTDGLASGTFQLPDTLSPGTYILRAYTNIMKNYSAGQYFAKNLGIYNPFSNKEFRRIVVDEQEHESRNISGSFVTVRVPSVCERREKVKLEIELDRRVITSPENTRLSISVASLSAAESLSVIDDYLSRKPDRKDLKEALYRPEREGHLLSGTLISQKPDAVLEDQILLLSVPGKEARFQYAMTDSEGNFSFVIDNEEIPDEVVVRLKENESGNLIRIMSPFLDTYPEYDIVNESLQAGIPPHIEEWIMNYQVSKIYGISSAGESVRASSVNKREIRFYGKPEMELRMADYILLPAMQEVFFELIPGVAMRTGRAGYGITVTNPYDNRTYEEDATLMIDGVIIDDPDIIAEMNPEIVERIDVIRNEYAVGGYHFYGIVNVITKSGNYGSFPLPANSVRFSYNINNEEIPFISPDYSVPGIKESRDPDFRNTLYWRPGLKPD